MVSAYVRAWRGTCAISEKESSNVMDARRRRIEEIISPWPTISMQPTPFQEDGRFAKAHPLNFPTGCGDILQSRFRSDFSTSDWVQHLLRYYTGHMQSSLRGHRILWGYYYEIFVLTLTFSQENKSKSGQFE